MEIYIGNLPWGVTEAEVKELFAVHGVVEKVSVILNRETGETRGFAFVAMPDEEQARKAIGAVNGVELRGRTLKVNASRGPRGHATYKTREGVQA